MAHPYADLPPAAFWRSAVAEAAPGALHGVWTPKFSLPPDAAVFTAGSCFAQHLGRALRAGGLDLIDAEPAPHGTPAALARAWGFGLYSGRFGNLYTARQFAQLLAETASGRPDPEAPWTWNGRFFDPVRPTLDPGGLACAKDVVAIRESHLRRLAAGLARATHVVFTLGLAETWADGETGRVWPTAPGVVAGRFDPARHRLLRFGWPEMMSDLADVRQRLAHLAPRARLILTVSPVALVATATGAHVLTANAGAKAVLRAAAGAFADAHDDVDYFPAWEIATNPAARGAFLAGDARQVTPAGVAAVLSVFLRAHRLGRRVPRRTVVGVGPPLADDDDANLFCDELLNAPVAASASASP